MVMPGPGFGSGVRPVKYELEQFPTTEQGHILLPVELSKRSFEATQLAIKKLGAIGIYGSRKFLDAEFDESTGCIDGSLTDRPGVLSRTVRDLAYVGNIHNSYGTIDPVGEIPSLCICNTSKCLNIRHYDLEMGANLRQKRQDIDLKLYRAAEDGRILTAWADELPSVDFSRRLFYLLRDRCFPYQDDTDSPLTVGSTASMKFMNATGCWAGDLYYRGDWIDLGIKTFQFDGYARLYDRLSRAKTNAHKLAHRVVWELFDGSFDKDLVLNHRCGFHRCFNPLHLDQVSMQDNVVHGRFMTFARAKVQSQDEQCEDWWKKVFKMAA